MTTLATPLSSLLDPELHADGDPHALWRWMRQNDPVCRHPATDYPEFWSVTRYEDIKAVYRDPATFSSAHGVLLRRTSQGDDPGAGLTLALTDPPRHKALRSIVADWFSTRSVRALEHTIDTAVRAVLARAIEQGECDFANDIAARLSLYVIGGILGVPEADHENLFNWTNEAFHASASLAAHQSLLQYLIDLMYQRMIEPTGDLLSALVTGEIDGELLTEEEILLNCENMIGATENGRLALIGGMQALLEHPDQWRRLREDRRLLPSAIEEILRWTSSATHSMRTATRPVVIGGRRIDAGDRVVVWLPSANRDESVFPDPDRFDITRSPNRHVAFGGGVHFCVGSALARAEARILLTGLMDLVGHVEQCGPVERVRSIAVSGPERLPVSLRPR